MLPSRTTLAEASGVPAALLGFAAHRVAFTTLQTLWAKLKVQDPRCSLEAPGSGNWVPPVGGGSGTCSREDIHAPAAELRL